LPIAVAVIAFLYMALADIVFLVILTSCGSTGSKSTYLTVEKPEHRKQVSERCRIFQWCYLLTQLYVIFHTYHLAIRPNKFVTITFLN